jgi:hypothetical protein
MGRELTRSVNAISCRQLRHSCLVEYGAVCCAHVGGGALDGRVIGQVNPQTKGMVMQKRIVSCVAAVLCAMLSLLTACKCACAEEATAPKKVPWKISGQLEEACSCNAACPCWFDSLPSRMNCGGVQVLFIEKGHYGKAKLDGLAMAHFGQSPDGQTMMESFGKWNFSYLYIDEKATPEQRDALETVGKTVLPFASSGNAKIQYVPITRTVDGKDHKITIGTVSTVQGHLIEGGLGGHPKIVNPPGADPIHHEYLQGQASKLAYNDASQNWNMEGRNYMRGEFTVDSEQYEKFAVGLAQKMAGMHKMPEPAK